MGVDCVFYVAVKNKQQGNGYLQLMLAQLATYPGICQSVPLEERSTSSWKNPYAHVDDLSMDVSPSYFAYSRFKLSVSKAATQQAYVEVHDGCRFHLNRDWQELMIQWLNKTLPNADAFVCGDNLNGSVFEPEQIVEFREMHHYHVSLLVEEDEARRRQEEEEEEEHEEKDTNVE